MFLPKFLTQRPAHRSFSVGGKLVFLLIVYCLLLIASIKPLHAFSTPNATYQFQFEQAIRSPEMNLQSFVYETLKAVMGSVFTTVTSCLTCSPEERGTGMIQTVSGFIALIYANPPASGVQYLADLGRRIGIVQPALAQETGFEKMKVYLGIWKVFRDITYVFFVLILVFMGFAIMFRMKISPQAVITIQSALPKVVIGLILVTFSYAIVGLLIDFMFVAANLIFFTLSDLPAFAAFTDLAQRIGYDLTITSDQKAFGILLLGGLLPSLAIMAFFLVLPTVAGSILGGILAIPTGGTSLIVAGGIDLAIILILAIIFLIALIRVLWTLLKAYVMVVISLIFAPFQILIGVLPGSGAIGSWFKNLIANLAVFPAILTMVLLSYYIIYQGLALIFYPIFDFLLGEINLSALIDAIQKEAGNLGAMTVLCFISLGILLMTPKVADMIKAFFAGKPFEYGAAIGEAMGPVTLAGKLGAAGGIGYEAGELKTKAYVEARPWLKKLIEEVATAAQKRTLGR